MKKHRKAFVCTSVTGKLDLRKRFHGRWVKKSNRTSPWGEPIIWRYRWNKEKKKIPESLNTLEGIYDVLFSVLWPLFAKKDKKKEKRALFHFLHHLGFEPKTAKKWQNRMSNFASTLVPSSGTCPGFTGLGGNRGKYIYELH